MWYFAKKYESDVRLDGKTAVVTGGNSGIGKETAKELYKRGARVLILSRDQIKSKQVIKEIKNEVKQIDENHDIRTKCLDLSDMSSVRLCAKEILKEEKQINLLINNAGVMGQPEQLSKDGFEIHFAANYLGHFLFTLLLMPLIIASGPARIINVSSLGHKIFFFARNFDLNGVRKIKHWLIFQMEGYCQSKCAQVMFNKELAKKLKDAGIHNVTTYSLHPGIVATDLLKKWDLFIWGLAWICCSFVSYFFFLTPEQGAKTTLYCAVDKELANESGLYYSNCSKDTVSKFVDNDELCRNLWDKSIEFANLHNYNPFKTHIK